MAALYKGNIQDNRINLIVQKNRGGLITPASDVITICQMTELLYRRLKCDILQFSQHNFAQNIAIAVFSRLIDKHLFKNLDFHTFDSEENHITILIKTISLCFIRIRNFHEVKQINHEMIGKNKRKVLTRLAIFQNV